MSKRIFKFYSDPSHGWLAVKTKELVDLGIANKISSFSYKRGQTSYLEEDCDAGIFLKMLDSLGVEYEFDERHTNKRHPIRSYPSYN